MNAASLVDLMLEMNVINVKDVDQEIAQLAAKITDPRARQWFKRVPRYWVINIDRLITQPCPDCGGTGEKDNQVCATCKGTGKQSVPYTAKAKPSTQIKAGGGTAVGSKYYANPQPGEDWVGGQGPEPQSDTGDWEGQGGMRFTGKLAGQPSACDTCRGTGQVKQITHHGTGQPTLAAADPRLDSEEERATYQPCPTCKGTGTKSPERLKAAYSQLPAELRADFLQKLPPNLRQGAMEAWIIQRFDLIGEATPFDPKKMDKRYGYDPKARTYKTALHEPVIQHDIEQSFTPFKPGKAKAKEFYGGPPSKNELEPWMTAPGSEKKEFHHFDPVQMRRRELWGKLMNLVNFLNYEHRLTKKQNFENDEERAHAQEAEALLNRLIQMRPDDMQGFQEVMAKAQEFGNKVSEEPWSFTKDGKVIASINNMQLKSALFDFTIIAMTNRPVRENTGRPDPRNNRFFLPNWPTNTDEKATAFSEAGQVYFIDRDNQPWLFLFLSDGNDWQMQTQLKNLSGQNIDVNVGEQIAPLFVDTQRFPPEKLLKVPVLARYANTPDRAQPVLDFDNGWKLVRMDHPLDLEREGVTMDHCVGGTSYTTKLTNGTHQYFSLRDPQNRPHVTVEIQRPNYPIQIKGYRDTTHFEPEVRDMMQAVIGEYGWDLSQCSANDRNGIIQPV